MRAPIFTPGTRGPSLRSPHDDERRPFPTHMRGVWVTIPVSSNWRFAVEAHFHGCPLLRSTRNLNVNIIRAIAIPAAAIMLLSGCMGQQLSTGETPRDNFIQTGEVKVVPITPELLAMNGAAAHAAAQVPSELLAYKPESYQIQPGDTLLVTVWDHPELSTP